MAAHAVKSRVKVKKAQSGSDSEDGSEHELFYYANDRVQLMKEVLKLLKNKKIKSIAPDFMKSLDIEEINSMLLEELLGISNKRLKNILNGVNVDESSSESEDEKPPIDVISLDDISDVEDFNFENNEPQKKSKKDRKEKGIDVKAEKSDEKEKLMSVLEILELQARARAIRSQLALENEQKKVEAEKIAAETDESDVEVVVQASKGEEIVIIDSENENMEEGVVKQNNNGNNTDGKGKGDTVLDHNKSVENMDKKSIRDNSIGSDKYSDKGGGSMQPNTTINVEEPKERKVEDKIAARGNVAHSDKKINSENHFADDSVVINLDIIEIEEIEQ